MESPNTETKSIEFMESKQEESKPTGPSKKIMKPKELSWIDSTVFNCTICDQNISGRKKVKQVG